VNEIARPAALLPWAPELSGEAEAPAPKRAPSVFSLLPVRIAWRQLRHEKARLASAIAGVMFACVLVFMQLGFRAALFDSATALPQSMKSELFLMHPMTTATFRPEPLPRARAWQTLAVPEVERAVPIYLAQATWRNPLDGSRRSIQLIGLDVEADAVAFEGLPPLKDALKAPDTGAFDLRSRPEFGPMATLLAERGPFEVQVGNRMVTIVGTVALGPSFGADGNLVTSETNFRRMLRERQAAMTDLVALRLVPGADVADVQRRLREILPPDVVVLTQAELVGRERAYWEEATPIGFIFAFGSLMGLVVGMVIVYQILFSDIASHLREYATLKAMGYSQGYLARVVLGAAVILAVLGFIPGLIASILLYDVVGAGTFLPLAMDAERAASVFAMIFTMCAVAGLLAMRKLRDANPADMF
jgi:putative ABC transport system permease protein